MDNQSIDRLLHQYQNQVVQRYSNIDSPLIPLLQEAQLMFGYVPIEVQLFLAKHLNISPAKIHGVVTFYSMFTTTKKGTHSIGVCMGTACYVKGAEKLLNYIQKELSIEYGCTTSDGKFTLMETRCVGDCANAPIVMINDTVHAKMTVNQLSSLIQKLTEKGQ